MFKTDYRISPAETQIIKAFAIVAMLVHHLFLENPEYGLGIYSLAIAGKVCVALFVFLSGYGMTMSFPQKKDSRLNTAKTFFFFLGKRYAKFYMNYWVVFAITVPIGIFCFGRTLEIAYGTSEGLLTKLISDIFGLRGFYSYNITWWFNELILVLWLLFPLLYVAMRNIVVSICIIIFLFVNPGDVLYITEIFANCLSIYMLPFALGIGMALHAERINKVLNIIPQKILLGTLALATFIFLFLRGVPLFPEFSYFRVDPFATVALALFAVCLCRETKLKFAPLQFVGKHSMNMYLTHTFIFGYFFHDFIYGLGYPILMFLALFGISLLISVIIEFAKNKLGFYRLQSKIVSLISRQIPSNRN